jgi:hypothetical protein
MTTTTFIVFLALFIVVIMWMARRTNRHQHSIDDKTEAVAQDALPVIGEIAERAHSRKFGRPPTNLPPAVPDGERRSRTSWYPESKRVAKRHA